MVNIITNYNFIESNPYKKVDLSLELKLNEAQKLDINNGMTLLSEINKISKI